MQNSTKSASMLHLAGSISCMLLRRLWRLISSWLHPLYSVTNEGDQSQQSVCAPITIAYSSYCASVQALFHLLYIVMNIKQYTRSPSAINSATLKICKSDDLHTELAMIRPPQINTLCDNGEKQDTEEDKGSTMMHAM